MKKFTKEMDKEIKIDRKISRKEKKKSVRYAKVDLKKSKSRVGKLNSTNKRIGTLEEGLKKDIGIIRTRLKMVNKQLRILTKKEEFLLKKINSFKKHEKENKGQIKIGKKDSERLAEEIK